VTVPLVPEPGSRTLRVGSRDPCINNTPRESGNQAVILCHSLSVAPGDLPTKRCTSKCARMSSIGALASGRLRPPSHESEIPPRGPCRCGRPLRRHNRGLGSRRTAPHRPLRLGGLPEGSFAADGKYLVSIDHNGTVRQDLWRPEDLLAEARFRLEPGTLLGEVRKPRQPASNPPKK
jgi:hypothetical protein